MVKTKGVAHFTIPVTDTRRSEAFYQQKLGMRTVGGSHDYGMIFLDTGGDCVILAKIDEPVPMAKFPIVHHAFIVAHDEYDAAVQDLKDNGVEIEYQEDRQNGTVRGPRAYFRDPDGNRLELIDLTGYAGAAA